MFVTDCSVGTQVLTPESAKEDMARTADSGVHQLRALVGLCNAAEFDSETLSQPLNERRIFGDATDQAALRFSECLGRVSELHQTWPLASELAFDSKNKFMARTFTLSELRGLRMCLGPVEATSFKQTKHGYVQTRREEEEDGISVRADADD